MDQQLNTYQDFMLALHLDALPQHFVEKRLHEERLVGVGGSLHGAQEEAFNVGEEDGSVAKVESLAVSSEPCVRVELLAVGVAAKSSSKISS